MLQQWAQFLNFSVYFKLMNFINNLWIFINNVRGQLKGCYSGNTKIKSFSPTISNLSLAWRAIKLWSFACFELVAHGEALVPVLRVLYLVGECNGEVLATDE